MSAKTIYLMGIEFPLREGALLRGHVPAHCNAPMCEFILHCSPAAAGECACAVTRHLPPQGVTSRRCILLPNYFGHLFDMFQWLQWKLLRH